MKKKHFAVLTFALCFSLLSTACGTSKNSTESTQTQKGLVLTVSSTADFVDENPEMSFALANAVLGYLDEKQHTERDIADLKAGWYKKTDFTVTTMIDGQEFRHSGRFDIGDGVGTGSGS